MSNTNELTVDVRGSLCPKPVIENEEGKRCKSRRDYYDHRR